MTDPLVSTEWLAAHLDDPDLTILDATFFLPGTPRDAAAEYAERHIPGARFFDLDTISDHASGLPHMMASPSEFAVAARRLGVNAGSTIIVYDGLGLFSAARVWWNFRTMGHEAVAVLDGGLPKWLAEGWPLETGFAVAPHGNFKSHPRLELVCDVDAVRAAIAGDGPQIVDARSAARFAGTEPEPRPGLRAGHIPGARNVPWASVANANGTLADAASLRALFEKAGIDVDGPIITSCGSGVTAAVLALALARLGRFDIPVYDGSWAEWGSRPDLPIETGPAKMASAAR